MRYAFGDTPHRPDPLPVNGSWGDDETGVFCLANVSFGPVALDPGKAAEGVAQVPGVGEYRIALEVRARRDAEDQRFVPSASVIVSP